MIARTLNRSLSKILKPQSPEASTPPFPASLLLWKGDIFEHYFAPGEAIPRLYVGAKLHDVTEVYLEDLSTHAQYKSLFQGRGPGPQPHAPCVWG